ncbi:coiled-coil domain-containing protein 81 isoform 2-T9 [Podargus strigoides]
MFTKCCSLPGCKKKALEGGRRGELVGDMPESYMSCVAHPTKRAPLEQCGSSLGNDGLDDSDPGLCSLTGGGWPQSSCHLEQTNVSCKQQQRAAGITVPPEGNGRSQDDCGPCVALHAGAVCHEQGQIFLLFLLVPGRLQESGQPACLGGGAPGQSSEPSQRTWELASLGLPSSAQHLGKGMAVDGLGVFYVLREYNSEVNRDVIVLKFHVLDTVALALGLIDVYTDIPDDIEIVPLDYFQLSLQTSLPEELVEKCVNEIMVLFRWGLGLEEDCSFVLDCFGSPMSWKRTLRYYEDFLLAVYGIEPVLECLLSNRCARIQVIPDEEPDVFHRHPEGIRMLPTLETKLPSDETVEDCFHEEERQEKEGSPAVKGLHQQKRHSLGTVTGAEETKGGGGDSAESESIDIRFIRLKEKFESQENEYLGKRMAKEEEAQSEKLPGQRRKVPPITLPGKKKDDEREQKTGVQAPKRSQSEQAPPAPVKSQTLGKQDTVEERRGNGRPGLAERCFRNKKVSYVSLAGTCPERSAGHPTKFSPMTSTRQKTADGKGEQKTGVQAPKRLSFAQAPPARVGSVRPLKKDAVEKLPGTHPEKRPGHPTKFSPITSTVQKRADGKGEQKTGVQAPKRLSFAQAPPARVGSVRPLKKDAVEKLPGTHPEKRPGHPTKFSPITSTVQKRADGKGEQKTGVQAPKRLSFAQAPPARGGSVRPLKKDTVEKLPGTHPEKRPGHPTKFSPMTSTVQKRADGKGEQKTGVQAPKRLSFAQAPPVRVGSVRPLKKDAVEKLPGTHPEKRPGHPTKFSPMTSTVQKRADGKGEQKTGVQAPKRLSFAQAPPARVGSVRPLKKDAVEKLPGTHPEKRPSCPTKFSPMTSTVQKRADGKGEQKTGVQAPKRHSS